MPPSIMCQDMLVLAKQQQHHHPWLLPGKIRCGYARYVEPNLEETTICKLGTPAEYAQHTEHVAVNLSAEAHSSLEASQLALTYTRGSRQSVPNTADRIRHSANPPCAACIVSTETQQTTTHQKSKHQPVSQAQSEKTTSGSCLCARDGQSTCWACIYLFVCMCMHSS
jgi:hypothetical protein